MPLALGGLITQLAKGDGQERRQPPEGRSAVEGLDDQPEPAIISQTRAERQSRGRQACGVYLGRRTVVKGLMNPLGIVKI